MKLVDVNQSLEPKLLEAIASLKLKSFKLSSKNIITKWWFNGDDSMMNPMVESKQSP